MSVFTMFALLVLCVNAHPGRTDGNGGHYNRSTGEYHYHHGYSAHDHYDMDGDGDLDCPYNFKDKTNHSSGSGGSSESSNRSPKSVTKENNVSTAQKSNTVTIWDVLKAMLEWLLPSIVIFVSSSYFLSFIFFIFLGKEKGCSVSLISGGIISIIAYVWLVIARLT